MIFESMIHAGHERVLFAHDAGTGLRAIVAVHSTALGPGFGGVRRWFYASEADALYDVLRLSEGMTYKAAAANVPIGGGKAVVMMRRPGAEATEAEARAMGRAIEALNGCYVAAEDVGLFPQYIDWMAQETKYLTGGDETGTGGDPSPHTAQGVVNAMKGALAHLGRPVDFAGLAVAIQGVGNVGTNVARILHSLGADLVVTDINQEAVSQVVSQFGARAVAPDEILTTECDIFSPCALGAVIDVNVIPKLRCEIICGGANNVLADYERDGAAVKASGITYVPDFIANPGGVIALAGLYVGLTEAERRQRLAEIEQTTRQVLEDSRNHSSTYAAAVALAKQRIADGRKANVSV